MINKLSDAIITSDYFGANVPLENLLSRRINIVFGANGSGKSTIADAFRRYASGDGSALQLPGAEIDEEGRRRIFVFDEQFVRNNLEMSANTKGLGTIVTIGEAVDRAKEEQELEKQIEEAEDIMEKAKTAKETADETARDLWRKIETELKKDGSYADLGKGIKCQIKKITVDPTAISAIMGVQNDPSIAGCNKSQLRNEILQGIESLKSTREQSKIAWFPSMLYVADLPKAWMAAKDLLMKEIEKPELSEREQKILQVGFSRTKAEILEKDADTCPLCHQPVSQEYRLSLAEIISRIENALKDVASGYKADLEACKAKCALVDYPVPEDVRTMFPSESGAFEQAYEKVKGFAKELEDKIEYRIQNVQAAPIDYDPGKLEGCYSALEKAANSLSSRITEHNKAVDNRDNLQNDLLQKNVILAYLEHESDFRAYREAVKRSEAEGDRYRTAKDDYDDCRRKLDSLRAKRSNTNEAREFINKCLEFIFMQPGRLELVSGDGEEHGIYLLKSNRHQVALDKVSVGERNAIALAYFFASTFRDKSVKDRYSDEALYVIDDPISSFDQGNRVGILTFIRDIFNNVVCGNKRSKILILTHDMQTAYNLITIVRQIGKEQEWDENDYGKDYLELNNRLLSWITQANDSNYHRLLREIYDFAAADSSGIDGFSGMGNKIRQLMESYTNFYYNSSLDTILNNDKVLESGVPSEFHNYYRRLSARIVFNAASHSGITTDALGDGRDSFTQKELQGIARNLLVFLDYTNPLHLDFVLKGKEHKRQIEKWKRQIPTEDEASMKARFEEIERLKKSLLNEVVTVEQDIWGNPHSGKCLLASPAKLYVGKKVRLTEVSANTSTKRDYPLFAKFTPDDSFGCH